MYHPPGDNQAHSNQRPIKVSMANMERIQVIEGHGEWHATRPKFTVPDGIQIVLYQGVGVGLDDTHGVDIAQGTAVPSRLPTLYDGHNHEYDTEPHASGGEVRQNTQGMRIYYSSQRCPDLTLYAPNEPGMTPFIAQAGSIVAAIGHPVTLQTLADRAQHGTQLRWAACTVIR